MSKYYILSSASPPAKDFHLFQVASQKVSNALVTNLYGINSSHTVMSWYAYGCIPANIILVSGCTAYYQPPRKGRQNLWVGVDLRSVASHCQQTLNLVERQPISSGDSRANKEMGWIHTVYCRELCC